jgi:cAMP-dependent protein kinase regulator
VIPDARAIAGDDDVTGVSDGVIEIPLDLELEYAFEELDIEEDGALSLEAQEALRETPLLASLSPDSLQSLITKVELVELDAGARLFREGDAGSTLYVVAEGEVSVISEGPPRVTLSTLGENQFFGEIALVTNQPRSATIEATVPTELLAIERDVFGDLVEEAPEVLKLMLRFLRDRLIHRLVQTSPLFGQFSAEDRKDLTKKFRFLEVEPGGAIIEQGVESDGLFVVLSGSLEVVRTVDGTAKRLATLGSGDLCGEMSLLSNDDAIATVKATTKSFVLELPAGKFRTTIMTHPQVLMYVGELAEERRRKFESIIDGSADYEEGHLDLV